MRKPKRGEIYRLKADGSQKPRPVVVVSVDILNAGHSVVAVPFYSQQLEKRRDQDWCAEFAIGEGGLDKDCVAKTDEISLIDKLDIDFAHGAIGKLDDSQMGRIEDAIRWSLALEQGNDP